MTGTSITKKGLKLLTKILASGEELNFTRAAVGTGSVPAGYDRENMIGLAAYKMDGTISRCVSDPENQQASIVMQVSSVGVTQGFTVTEAGIFAQDPDEGEILYAYTDMTEDPQYIYPEDSEISKFMELTLVVVIGSVEKVTAYINPGSLITSEEFYGLKKELEAGKTKTEFTEASDRENIESGETISVIFGKIKKWFSDLKSGAFANVVNNCAVTEEGTVLDGRQGKALQDQITQLQEADEAINSNIETLGGFTPVIDSTGKITGYKTEAGADTVFPFSDILGFDAALVASKVMGIWTYGTQKISYTANEDCIIISFVTTAITPGTSSNINASVSSGTIIFTNSIGGAKTIVAKTKLKAGQTVSASAISTDSAYFGHLAMVKIK